MTEMLPLKERRRAEASGANDPSTDMRTRAVGAPLIPPPGEVHRESPSTAPGNSSTTVEANSEEAGSAAEPSPPPLLPPAWTPAPEPAPRRRSSAPLIILATLAILYTMALAKVVLLPLVLACMLALTLRPVVRSLEQRGVPRLLTSIGLLVIVLGSLLTGIFGMVEPAQTWIEQAPRRLQVVGHKLNGVRERLQELSSVSERLESIAAGETEGLVEEPEQPKESWWSDLRSGWRRMTSIEYENKEETLVQKKDREGEARENREPVEVQLRQPRLSTSLTILSSAGNILGMLGFTLVLSFFLLLEGDILLNNVLGTLPRFRDKKNAVRLVYHVERGISQYLLTVSLINIGLGVVIGLAMWGLQVPNPALWGLMATVLNFIPFLGAMMGVVVIFLVAVFSFDSLTYAFLVPAVYFSITALEGNFITPALVGRSVSVNSIAVLASIVVWGWLWGIGGALIAVPLLIIFKLTCDQFEQTASVGALLAGRRGLP